jgi:TPP-dependent 2-oxoacid decarboxylase
MNNTDAHKNVSNDVLTDQHTTEETTTPQGAAHTIEDQLAHIITSAREVAIVAEELLREFSARETITGSVSAQQTPHAIALAPRLIAATQQQLLSLLAMLRTV